MACAIPVELISDSSPNAFTTGDRIVIHTSIMRIARTMHSLRLCSDMSLRMPISAIWKSNGPTRFSDGPAERQSMPALILGRIWTGGIFARQFARAGERAFSVDFEREADYVGAYYAARAGYDLTGAEEFWRTFSLESPDAIRTARTHPVTPIRFVQMQKVAAEIADKQRRNAH